MKKDKRMLLPENQVRRFAQLANIRLNEEKIKEMYGEEDDKDGDTSDTSADPSVPTSDVAPEGDIPPTEPEAPTSDVPPVGGEGDGGMGISKEQQEEIVKSVMDAVAGGLQGLMPDASVSVEGGEGEPTVEPPVETPPVPTSDVPPAEDIPPVSGDGPSVPATDGEDEKEPLDEVQIALVAEVVRRVVKKLRENKAKKNKSGK